MPALVQELLPAGLAARLTDEQRQTVIETPRADRLAALALALGVKDDAILSELAAASGLDIALNLETDPGARGLLPARLVHDYQIIPIRFGPPVEAGQEAEVTTVTPLHMASCWLPDEAMADWLRTFTPRPIVWHLAVPERVHQLIIENFGVGSGALEDSDEGYVAPEAQRQAEEVVDEDAAVVRFVSDVISQAVEDQATDIHFEPQEGQLRIRYRVDGLLVPVPVPENLLRFQDAIISRVKIMARLNISERRLPQDGRINFKAAGTVLDIRVSTIPTIYAESISLRLLNQKKEAYTMDRLGMNAEEQAQIIPVLEYPHGIILVTGPTGSGKSTSLNAFLRKINSTDLRIITIEDPIEYEVPGVNQMQVRSEIGLTFASALRHVLRQDPDVIMVGEIRDQETADIAIRASLTGHLVFSTLHTNDAPGAITRLVDMGIEPFLVASAIELVIAQRLVRRLCPDCTRPEPISQVKLLESLSILGCDPAEADTVTFLNSPVGCDRCRGTGYRGRIGVFEIFRLNDELHELILKRESTRTLTQCARKNGIAHPGAEQLAEGQGRPHNAGRGPARHDDRGEVREPGRHASLRLHRAGPLRADRGRRPRRPHPQGRRAPPGRPRPDRVPPGRGGRGHPGRQGCQAGAGGQAGAARAREHRDTHRRGRPAPDGPPAFPRVPPRPDDERSVRRRGRAAPLGAHQGTAAARPGRGPVGPAERGLPALARDGGLPEGLRFLHDQPDPRRRGDRFAERHDRAPHHPPDRAEGAAPPAPHRAGLPIFMVFVSAGVILFFLFFLLPRLQTLLTSLHGQMPASTRFLIGLSDFALHYGVFVAIALVAGSLSFWRWRSTEAGRIRSDAWLLRLPLVGPFVVSQTVLAFSQTLSVLLENGITASDALRMTERQIDNRVHREAFNTAIDRVLEGEALSAALARTGCFPDLVLDRLSVGENTGNVVPSLKDVSRNYQKQISNQLNIFTKVIASGVLMTVFIFVGFIAFAIVSAVFQVSASFKMG